MRLPNVSYERGRRAWVVLRPDGSRKAFAAGADGRRAATEHAVSVLSPPAAAAAAAIVERFPYLWARAWEAAAIVATAPIVWTGAGWIVPSAAGEGEYTVSADDDVLTCDCQDYTGWGAPPVTLGQRTCKHILAVTIARQTHEKEVKRT